MPFSFLPFLPELFLLAGLLIFIIVGSFLNIKSNPIKILKLIVGITTFLTLLSLIYSRLQIHSVYIFENSFILDSLAWHSKLFLVVLFGASLSFGGQHLIKNKVPVFEFYTLLLISIIGSFVTISATHALSMYLGIELISLSFYGLIALQRNDSHKSEVAMKYFVLGALSSGLLLYGISMIYLQTGSFSFQEILSWVHEHNSIQDQVQVRPYFIYLGVAFIVIACSFKLGIFPFHQWMPDVYHGGNTITIMYLSFIPKLAVGILLLRFLENFVFDVYRPIFLLITILSIGSLIFGNLVAIAQTNIKRLLAYSTVSHMGFIYLTIISGSIDKSTVLFYLYSYLLTTLFVFMLLLYLDDEIPNITEIDQLRGLSTSHPFIAFCLLTSMLSLAGIPPFIGFYAKFNVLIFLAQNKLYSLVVFAALISVVGAYYYLALVKKIYFESNSSQKIPVKTFSGQSIIIGITFIVFTILSLYPEFLYKYSSFVF